LVSKNKINNNDENKIFHKYNLFGNKFKIPEIGTSIRIWDFDFSCIYPFIINTKVETMWAKNCGVNSYKNRYYDIHFLLNSLVGSNNRSGFVSDFMTNQKIPIEVKNFACEIIPENLREGNNISPKGRLIKNYEYITPIEVLLKSNFFSEFRNENKTNHT